MRWLLVGVVVVPALEVTAAVVAVVMVVMVVFRSQLWGFSFDWVGGGVLSPFMHHQVSHSGHKETALKY